MNNDLALLLDQESPDALNDYLDRIPPAGFSLVTLIDALAPKLVMESNLRFGSFHLIKMSLFLRKLSLRGVLSRETELALGRVVARHLYYLEWIQVTASPHAHAPDPVRDPIDNMLEEIRDGNAHNAFFYADIARKTEKEALLETLLQNGVLSVPDTLGHSVSCFYPVLEDLVDTDHPASGTALLSYIMYLCRHRRESSPDSGPAADPMIFDRTGMLQKAASGTGIVDIHHMITYYFFTIWERAPWHKEPGVPWSLLVDWIGNKNVDARRQETASRKGSGEVPSEYGHWRRLFAEGNRQETVSTALAMLEHSWPQACDWLFRSYSEYYTPDWDPHYFTSLYVALELYRNDDVGKVGGTMAVIQALEYFLDNR